MTQPVQPGQPSAPREPIPSSAPPPKLPDLSAPGTPLSERKVTPEFSDLPDDVIECILSMLSMESKTSAGEVSKKLRHLSFESIRHLDLSRQTKLDPKSFAELLNRCPHLTSIRLPQNATDGFLEALATWPNRKTLTHLDCIGCAQLTDSGFQSIALCPNLKELIVTYTSMGDATLAAICRACEDLTVLHCDACENLTDEGFKGIALCKKLQELNIRNSQLGDSALREIWQNCKELVGLDCYNCKLLTDEGFKNIVPNTKLQKLYLGATAVGNPGLISICKACPELITLACSGCTNLSNDGFQAIALCKKLKALYLNWTKIEDRALISICQACQELAILECNACEGLTISPEEFERRFPNVRIT